MSAGTPSTVMVFANSSKNGMLKFDSSMFSGSENSLRTPPDARGVEARA
jgi:hypothetical protein